MICEDMYAPVLAFSFLTDLKREFLQQYPKQAIEKAVRPYSFIEFDNFIQKTKQKYNNPRSLTMRVDLAELTQELQRDPPYEITGASITTGERNKSPPVSVKGHQNKLTPLSWLGMAACCITSFCALLNLIRIVPFVSEHGNEPQEEAGWVLSGLCFLFSGFINAFQCYLMLKPVSHRQHLNILASILNICLVIRIRDLRNLLQIVFHLTATCFISFMTWKRPLQGKIPNYNV